MAKRSQGSLIFSKNVTLLKSSECAKDGKFLMPNTIDIAKLKKLETGQYKRNVEFSISMSDLMVRQKLQETFSSFDLSGRFYCASYGHDSLAFKFHGEPRVWDGKTIRRHVRGNSALYVLLEDDQSSMVNETRMETFETNQLPDQAETIASQNGSNNAQPWEQQMTVVNESPMEIVETNQVPNQAQAIALRIENTNVQQWEQLLQISDSSDGYVSSLDESSSSGLGGEISEDERALVTWVEDYYPHKVNIRPNSSPLEGGDPFRITFDPVLDMKVTSGSAEFQDVGKVELERLKDGSLVATIPASKVPGEVTVVVESQVGGYLGKTKFRYYADGVEEVLEQIATNENLQRRLGKKLYTYHSGGNRTNTPNTGSVGFTQPSSSQNALAAFKENTSIQGLTARDHGSGESANDLEDMQSTQDCPQDVVQLEVATSAEKVREDLYSISNGQDIWRRSDPLPPDRNRGTMYLFEIKICQEVKFLHLGAASLLTSFAKMEKLSFVITFWSSLSRELMVPLPSVQSLYRLDEGYREEENSAKVSEEISANLHTNQSKLADPSSSKKISPGAENVSDNDKDTPVLKDLWKPPGQLKVGRSRIGFPDCRDDHLVKLLVCKNQHTTEALDITDKYEIKVSVSYDETPENSLNQPDYQYKRIKSEVKSKKKSPLTGVVGYHFRFHEQNTKYSVKFSLNLRMATQRGEVKQSKNSSTYKTISEVLVTLETGAREKMKEAKIVSPSFVMKKASLSRDSIKVYKRSYLLMKKLQLLCDNGKWDDFDNCVRNLLLHITDIDTRIVIKLEQSVVALFQNKLKLSRKLIKESLRMIPLAKNPHLLAGRGYRYLARLMRLTNRLGEADRLLQFAEQINSWFPTSFDTSLTLYERGSVLVNFIALAPQRSPKQVSSAMDHLNRCVEVCLHLETEDDGLSLKMKHFSLIKLAMLSLDCRTRNARVRGVSEKCIARAQHCLGTLEMKYWPELSAGVRIQYNLAKSDLEFRKGNYEMALESAELAMRLAKTWSFHIDISHAEERICNLRVKDGGATNITPELKEIRL
ncbi:uncharacterized protein LOC111325645 isoform X2 [Stylophora pistillata]|uniref:uncharacterized protein LOC111325645 isoform X2 n=1 Tax=Stylophora pistillata TaxID=50429 RepID=UPI000C040985|nr:uncharacterized protein LOC111325645 isoform X2 [Stylophora pistillata]